MVLKSEVCSVNRQIFYAYLGQLVPISIFDLFLLQPLGKIQALPRPYPIRNLWVFFSIRQASVTPMTNLVV